MKNNYKLIIIQKRKKNRCIRFKKILIIKSLRLKSKKIFKINSQ